MGLWVAVMGLEGQTSECVFILLSYGEIGGGSEWRYGGTPPELDKEGLCAAGWTQRDPVEMDGQEPATARARGEGGFKCGVETNRWLQDATT